MSALRQRPTRPLRPGPAGLAAALAAGLLAGLVAGAPAAAEVRVEKGPDGRVVVFNVPRPGEAARRSGSSPALPARTEPRARESYVELVAEHSEAQGLDPRLVAAVIQVESAWNRRARSRKGAMGLMQLMPETAVVLAVDDPYDPAENLRGGTAYLKRLVDHYEGRLDLALAAYNAGPTAVDRYGGVPPYLETREYVRRVLSLYEGREVPLPEAATRTAAARPPRLVRGPDDRLLLTNRPAD